MRKTNRPKLIAGPYSAPPVRIGDVLPCSVRGRKEVEGISDAPIPWPYGFPEGQKWPPMLIVFDDLEKAVRTESAVAVAYWFGVHRDQVTKWRKALGVEKMNQGSRARFREASRENLTLEDRRAGGRATAGKPRRREMKV